MTVSSTQYTTIQSQMPEPIADIKVGDKVLSDHSQTLTPSQNAGCDILPGKAGIKGGAYLRFFGGPFAGLRIPLASP